MPDLTARDWPVGAKFKRPDGGDLAYFDTGGQGPSIVLLHGFTDHSISFLPLLGRLSGHRLILPDLRGHGASARATAYDLDGFAGDVEALIAAMSLDRPFVIGHSMGAMTALRLAARGRTVLGGLVTLAGTLRPVGAALTEMHKVISGLTDPIDPHDPFFAGWHSGAERVGEAFHARLLASACAMPADDWRAISAAIARVDLTRDVGRIAAPALVIGGADDPLFGPDHHAPLAAGLRAERHLIAGVGHNPHWQRPEEVADHILRFLATRAG